MPPRRAALDVARGVHPLGHLLARGLSREAVDREVALGRWQRPARAVLVSHADPLTDVERVEVGRAHAGEDAVLTGGVVLRRLGLRWVPASDSVRLLVPADQHTRSSGIVVLRRTEGLAELETWSWWGGRVAHAERAVYDEAMATRTLRDVRGLVLGAVADGWATPQGLMDLVVAGQRNGSALVRRAALDAARGCASPPEAELVDGLVGRGLPFLVNPGLYLHGVLLGYPDVYPVGLGLCGEVQSRERHGSEADEESTYDRDERFAGHGLATSHLSVRLIRADLGGAVERFLAAARRRLALPPHLREPPGLEVRPRGPVLS
jgi:hypothetical protein